MLDDISNFQIKEAFNNINDEDIYDNLASAFLSNHINKFIDNTSMISHKKGKYPFVVANTDSSSKSGTHWWSVLNIKPKTNILFSDSFGLDSLKNFII